MKDFTKCAAFLAAAGMAAISAQADPLPPEQKTTVDKLIEAGLKDDTGLAFVEDLTTEIGPRLAGSPAEQRARDWAVAELKALGFANVRVEDFEIPYWARTHESWRSRWSQRPAFGAHSTGWQSADA